MRSYSLYAPGYRLKKSLSDSVCKWNTLQVYGRISDRVNIPRSFKQWHSSGQSRSKDGMTTLLRERWREWWMLSIPISPTLSPMSLHALINRLYYGRSFTLHWSDLEREFRLGSTWCLLCIRLIVLHDLWSYLCTTIKAAYSSFEQFIINGICHSQFSVGHTHWLTASSGHQKFFYRTSVEDHYHSRQVL